MNVRKLSKDIFSRLKARGIDKSRVIASIRDKEELQYEFGEIDLLRSFQENSISISAIKDNKQAQQTLNQLDTKSIDEAIDAILEQVENSQPDPAYDIAPYQEPAVFELGPMKPDRDKMYQLIDEFQKESLQKYSGLRLEGNISHTYSRWHYLNSNGVDYQQNRGGYIYSAMFSAREGKKASSFNYTFGFYLDLSRSFWELDNLDELLKQSVQSIHAKPVPETFEGDIIMLPSITEEFFNYLAGMHLTDRMMITGNSILKGKIGEKVISDKITVTSSPLNPDLAGGYFVTGDGYKSENMPIFTKGTLNNYMLSQYGANKTGLPMSKSGDAYIMDNGEEELADMISSIDKGLLLVRFSGGYPSISGDFSGVAKNSFYIENGKVSYPVNETMISGNLLDLFNNVKSVSSERINNGNSIMPWMKCGGVTISR